MSVIYIIAGPPGVGKSTSGEDYIDPDLDILNEDEMRFKYKAKGYADYNEYSLYRVRDIIKSPYARLALRSPNCRSGTKCSYGTCNPCLYFLH